MGSIDEIRERLPIEQVVGKVVALKRAGSVYKGLCPFHSEKTPSFIVTPSRGRYHCFGCGNDGDIFNFVMARHNLDFQGALQQLAAEAGVTLEDPRQGAAAGALETRIYELNAAAATYFQAMLAAAPGTQARDYLQRRRITSATIENFGLGYAPDSRDALCRRLREAGYTDDELVAAGLAIAPEATHPDEGGRPSPIRDRWHGRLIFPIRDAKGRIRGFGGRLLGPGEPKYLNSPATALFDKSRVLYTIEHAADAIRSAREGVVVEGYVDALRAHQEGFTNVVATLGTAITEHQLRALARLAPRLVLALDADPAGQKAVVRAGLAALSAVSTSDTKGSMTAAAPGAARRDPVHVFVATLPEGLDPDDAITADPEGWRGAIAGATPLMDHYFTLVEAGLDRTRAEWRQEAIDTLVPVIGQLNGVGLQQTYIERLAGLTGIDARYLRDLTPGGAPAGAPRRRETRRHGPAVPPSAPAGADPVRVTEEYLAGLLLLHRPLPPEVCAELASYTPLTPDLAPLFAALLRAEEPGAAEEDLAERLATAAAQRPVPPDQLPGVAHICLVRISAERERRALTSMGQVVADVDRETAHEMDSRALEVMTLKEQLTIRLQQEQSRYYRRQPAAASPDGAQ